MKNPGKYFIALLLALLWINPSWAGEFPEPKASYSADMVMSVWKSEEGRQINIQGKIYASRDKERREIFMMGRKSIMIIRRDKGVTWVLMPEQRMYSENIIGIKGGEDDPSMRFKGMNVKLTKIGKETVNKISTTKYKVAALDPDGSKTEGFLWLSKDNIPVKMEGKSWSRGEMTKFKKELTNLQLGKQEPQLFKIPKDYKKFNMPFMGGMPPGGMSPGGMPPGAGQPGGMSPEQMKQMQELMRKKMEEMMKRYEK